MRAVGRELDVSSRFWSKVTRRSWTGDVGDVGVVVVGIFGTDSDTPF